jgi:uncharacterized protein (DUF111 family)
MPICYLDPFSGISGDMTLGALLVQVQYTLFASNLDATFPNHVYV